MFDLVMLYFTVVLWDGDSRGLSVGTCEQCHTMWWVSTSYVCLWSRVTSVPAVLGGGGGELREWNTPLPYKCPLCSGKQKSCSILHTCTGAALGQQTHTHTHTRWGRGPGTRHTPLRPIAPSIKHISTRGLSSVEFRSIVRVNYMNSTSERSRKPRQLPPMTLTFCLYLVICRDGLFTLHDFFYVSVFVFWRLIYLHGCWC